MTLAIVSSLKRLRRASAKGGPSKPLSYLADNDGVMLVAQMISAVRLLGDAGMESRIAADRDIWRCPSPLISASCRPAVVTCRSLAADIGHRLCRARRSDEGDKALRRHIIRQLPRVKAVRHRGRHNIRWMILIMPTCAL